MYASAGPLLFRLDPERAHGLTLTAMDTLHRVGLSSLIATPPQPLPTEAFGLQFPNPVGLAAGLDTTTVCRFPDLYRHQLSTIALRSSVNLSMCSARFVAMMLTLMASAVAAQSAVNDCDRLASSPHDPQKKSAGVSFAQLNARSAVAACKSAVAAAPGEGRLWFQYGRALEKSGNLPGAVKAYEEAGKLSHAVAFNNLGELYRDGKHFERNLTKARDLFKTASDLGSQEGKTNYAAVVSAIEGGAGRPIPEPLRGRYSASGMSCKDTLEISKTFGGQYMGTTVTAFEINQQQEFSCKVERLKESGAGEAVAGLRCSFNAEPVSVQAVLTGKEVRIKGRGGVSVRCS